MRVSVIVPTLDEEATVAGAVESARQRGDVEIIVVDGGSRDRTIAAAAPLADRVLVDGDGLAAQLNRGAAAAAGDAFLFLYADACLPAGGIAAVEDALADGRVAGGAFRLAFDADRLAFRLIALAGNLRNRFGLGPFGDQAIFVRREVFEAVGGFRSWRYLEDLDLVRRVRRRGRFHILEQSIRTSTRRWQRDGLLRTAATHLSTTAAYLLGKRERDGWFGARVDRLRQRR